MMSEFESTSVGLRKARNRQLIQLGAVIEKAGLMEAFEITQGAELKKDHATKLPVAALFKSLLELNQMAQSGDIHMQLYAQQGLAELKKSKREEAK